MRRSLWVGILILGFVLVACTDTSHSEFDEEPHGDEFGEVDEHEDGEAGGLVVLYLDVEVTDPQVEELADIIGDVAEDAEIEFVPSTLEISITPERSAELSECLLWDGPYLEVSSDPEMDVAGAIVEAVVGFESVARIDAPELGIGLEEAVGEEGENVIEMCQFRQVSVLLDPTTDLDLAALREHALTIPGVLGASTSSIQETPFTPDLSEYSEAQSCYQPHFDSLTVYLEEAVPELGEAVVTAFNGSEGIAGFFGVGIDPALDPIHQWEMTMFGGEGESFNEEHCLGLEVHVGLDWDITDEEAAVVVARAKAIEGVADVYLRLVDAPDGEECESNVAGPYLVALRVLPDTVEEPCFIPSSGLTIYRGDQSTATLQAICDALCLLPGVIVIDSENYELESEEAGAGFSQICRSAKPGSLSPSQLVVPQDLDEPAVEGVTRSSGGSPPPDILGSVPCDDGGGSFPLNADSQLPDTIQLDFLFDFCGEICSRDAHFLDPSDPDTGSGPFTANGPFHVRHGFVNDREQPLGEEFDVVIYITPINETEYSDGDETSGESGKVTYRFTSDYKVRGTSDRCGPTYGTQSEPVTCEWFVHDFSEGLPAGRHAMWAVWEAPCSAWIDYGFTDSCSDPHEIISLFSSGVDSPFGYFPPRYDEPRETTLANNDA